MAPRWRILFLSCAFYALLLSLAAPAVAQFETREFFVDPTRSFVQVDPTSEFVFALPAPLGTLSASLVAQTDPSVSGSVLPGLGASDGTITALDGGFFLSLLLPNAPGEVGSINGGEASQLFTVADSGSWLPGDASGPVPGQLAVEVGLPSVGLGAEIVLRDLALTGFNGGDLNYVSDQVRTFPAQPFFLDPMISTTAVEGVVWVRGFGFRGAMLVPFGNVSLEVPADSGTLTRLGAEDYEISIPFSAVLDIGPAAAFSGHVELDLSGQIVANTVPEPSLGLGLGIGLALLAMLASRRRREGEGRSRALVYLTAAFLLGPACFEPSLTVNPDLDADGELDPNEVQTYVAGEGSGSSANAQIDSGGITIRETGQSDVTASCGGGSCTASLTASTGSGCGTVELRSDAKGFEITVADACGADTEYSGNIVGRQTVFNMSSVDKTFLVTPRLASSVPPDLSLFFLVNFFPLFLNTTRVIVVPPFSSQDITMNMDLVYDAGDPGDEWANIAIDVTTTSGTCTNDLECGSGSACLAQGVCVTSEPDSLCSSHADCPDGLSCIQPFGRCRTPSLYPDPCNADWDCEGNCISSLCSEGLQNHPCNSDDDCDDATAPFCTAGFCSS